MDISAYKNLHSLICTKGLLKHSTFEKCMFFDLLIFLSILKL